MCPTLEIDQTDAFHPRSLRFLREADLQARKSLGQFLTPKPLRERLLDHVRLAPGMKVLDPGAGSGEFLLSCQERVTGLDLVGWEVDSGLSAISREVCPAAAMLNVDALTMPWSEDFDLVVGNPPYFQVPNSHELRQRFDQVISGRPNIFALFFQIGLSMLKPGGQLAYVVPPSMNNGAYFRRLREFICSSASIDHLEVVTRSDWFHGAQTAVQLIVVTKGSQSRKHIFEIGCGEEGLFSRQTRLLLFAEAPRRLASFFRDRRTLFELGYKAVTGTVVWNQRKSDLRKEKCASCVPLLWAHNIREGKVVLDVDHRKPQYLLSDTSMVGPAILVNRISGSVGTGTIRAGIVPSGMRFLAENHVNVVLPRAGVEQAVVFDDLLRGLAKPDTLRIVRELTGNTQVSATELTHLLPLDCN